MNLTEDEVLRELDGLELLYTRFRVLAAKVENVIDRTLMIHDLIDREIQAVDQSKVQCRKGCTACCHLPVHITSGEAKVLAQLLLKEEIEIDHHRLNTQSEHSQNDSFWLDPAKVDNQCIFLNDEGACKVYAHRPQVCRKHLVTSAPEECSKPASEQKIDVHLIPNIEVLSIASTSLDHFGLMAKMIRTELEKN